MKFKKKCEVIVEFMGDECILLPKIDGVLEFKKCIYLEGIGGEIWMHAQKYSDTEEIVKEVSKSYKVDEITVRDDIKNIFNTFVQAGIVEEV